MGNSTRRLGPARAALTVGLALAFGWGCAGSLGRGMAYQYFDRPDPDDAWSRKIQTWQHRERVDLRQDAPAAVAGPGEVAEFAGEDPGELRIKYDSFRLESRRALARELAEWIQRESRAHYVPDGPIDRWATLEETFRSNGDDCDGLELLAYHFLRDLGFGESEVYRAIVYRRSDGQHHMVTLWFEDPDDPWVIDPTGAMTSGMPRMSSIPDWVPLKVFSEEDDFTVRQRAAAAAAPRR